jgi:hypothetical protein
MTCLCSELWIPITKRLPKPLEVVLVYDRTQPYWQRRTLAKFGPDGVWYHQGGFGHDEMPNVTHWWPLPNDPEDSAE